MPAVACPHIRKVDGGTARLGRIPRIRVAQIIADHLGSGWSAEEIVRQHEHLTPAEVHAAFAYYFDHREEIEAEDARPPSPLHRRLFSLRRAYAV